MPNNYILLETIALTQSAASVTFDNLPTSGYTDLKIVVSGRSDRNVFSWTNIKVQFNGSASGYTYRNLLGDGSTASSVNNTNDGEGSTGIMVFSLDQANSTASTFGNAEIYIPNYRSSNNKSVSADGVMELNGTNASIGLTAGLWSNTAAITSITLTPQISGSTFNFVANSTFSLYGIAALGTTPVVAPKATGGNRIENDGTYWIHTFLTSGTFTPQVGLTCDYLVVAGGGGGGRDGGGGGAGGLRSTVTATGGGGSLESAISVTSGTNYAITIGAGGAGGVSGVAATNGVNSIFSTITSTGGGAGGGDVGTATGFSGGSGGGTKRDTTNNTGGGANTANQGYVGGVGCGTSFGGAGGGGGAGAIGGKGVSTGTASGERGGAGGNGVATSITATSITYAGGGGGANFGSSVVPSGGTGGGGNGGAWDFANSYASRTYSTAGTVNTGGGGGGDPGTGSAGGSGIVIIRYPIA